MWEGGTYLALLSYIKSKLILPRQNTPSHFGNVAFSGINIQFYQMISNKDLTSKKISNQQWFKNISWSIEDHIFYYAWDVLSNLGWLVHLVSWFACNARVIVDASSDPPVSNVKSL